MVHQRGGRFFRYGVCRRGDLRYQGGYITRPPRHPVEAPQEFPYTQDAMFTSLQGSTDAMFMGISPDGRTLIYSTFFGGKDSDRTYGLAVDPAGNVVLAGLTFSSDFPLKNPAQTWPGNLMARTLLWQNLRVPGADEYL